MVGKGDEGGRGDEDVCLRHGESLEASPYGYPGAERIRVSGPNPPEELRTKTTWQLDRMVDGLGTGKLMEAAGR